jgi:hypothetical protein
MGAVVLMAAFAVGRDYQKEHGPPGNECKAGSFRPHTQDRFAAECVNGFWFDWGPRVLRINRTKNRVRVLGINAKIKAAHSFHEIGICNTDL